MEALGLQGLGWLLDWGVKAATIVATAWVLDRLLRRRSASVRNLAWRCAFVGVAAAMLLPLATRSRPVGVLRLAPPEAPTPRAPLAPAPPLTPVQAVAIGAATKAAPAIVAPVSAPERSERLRPYAFAPLLLALWASVAGGLLFRLLIGHALAARGAFVRSVEAPEDLQRELWLLARDSGIAAAPALRISADTRVPFAWGLWRYAVVLPESASGWDAETRRAVLLHELAHVRRGDLPFQLLADVLTALLWFHPALWYAQRRLRFESERACDDAVVSETAQPSAYARIILEFARSAAMAAPRREVAAMARTHPLAQRIASILDGTAPRRAAGRFVCSLGLAGAVAAAATLSMFSLRIEAEPATPESALSETTPNALASVRFYGTAAYSVAMEMHNAGHYEVSSTLFRRAVQSNYLRHLSAYNVACAEARAGNAVEALRWLSAATALGFYDHRHAAEDEDLASLRGYPEFAESLARMKNRCVLGTPELWGKESRIPLFSSRAEFATLEPEAAELATRALEAPHWERFLAETDRCLELGITTGEVHFRRGYAQLLVDRPEEAIESFERALAANAMPRLAAYNLACAHARSGDSSKAIYWLFRTLPYGAMDAAHVSQDVDLASLRGLPAFDEFLRTIGG